MLLFRSEEHLDEWIDAGNPRGETMTVAQQWALARVWFQGRDLLSWRRRSPQEAQEVLLSVGLDSDFWSFS